jgi:rod shape-determining protein MreD
MKRVGLIVIFGALLLLQVTFVAALRPLGVVPDIVLIAVILIGLTSTVSEALIAALAGGLVLDLASGADFGLRTGLFVLAALTTGVVRRAGLMLGGPVVAVGLVAIATILETVIILANVRLVGWPLGYVGRTLGTLLMVNLVLTLILRPLFVWLAPRETTWPTIE